MHHAYIHKFIQANHDITHCIASLISDGDVKGEELLTTVVPLRSCLLHLQRSLPFPLKRVKEDSLILAKMSTMLPDTHTLALVFRDIAALCVALLPTRVLLRCVLAGCLAACCCVLAGCCCFFCVLLALCSLL